QAAGSNDCMDRARTRFVDDWEVTDDRAIAPPYGDFGRIVVALVAMDVLADEPRVGGRAGNALFGLEDRNQAIDHGIPNEGRIRGQTITVENVFPIFEDPC